MIACKRGHTELMKLLLNHPRVVHKGHETGFAALSGRNHQLIKLVLRKDPKLVEKLLKLDKSLAEGELPCELGFDVDAYLKQEGDGRRKIEDQLFLSWGIHRKNFAAELLCIALLYCDGYLAFKAPPKASLASQNNLMLVNSSAEQDDVNNNPVVELVQETHQRVQVRRFFQISYALPLELQMLLSNRVYQLRQDSIPDSIICDAFEKILETF